MTPKVQQMHEGLQEAVQERRTARLEVIDSLLRSEAVASPDDVYARCVAAWSWRGGAAGGADGVVTYLQRLFDLPDKAAVDEWVEERAVRLGCPLGRPEPEPSDPRFVVVAAARLLRDPTQGAIPVRTFLHDGRRYEIRLTACPVEASP